MRKQTLWVFWLFFIFSNTYAHPTKLIDLTHSFNEKSMYFPVGRPFLLHKLHAGETPNHYYVAENAFESSEHTGTHMDAPNHFAQGHPSVDQIPLENLTGLAIKVDVSRKALDERDYQISIEDLLAWEAKHGKIPKQAIVLLQTGYSQFWPNRKEYLGTAKLGTEGVKELHFPGLDPKAAHWLVAQRQIKAVGIDTGSIDYGQTQNYAAHQFFTSQNIPIFENVAHLEALPAKNFDVYALPMKISQGTGAPLRIIAVVKS